jgi:peptidoglycan/xylan/chitin deacetylase (PgdA/CDA1 family)/archaellum component FlaG (FlaF/FlaG flagellin family)
MITIAVVASLVVYAWVFGYINFTTAKTGNSLVIQSVANCTGGSTAQNGNLTIYVQNTGEGLLYLTSNSFYVDSTPREIVSLNGAPDPSIPFKLEQGKTVSVVLNYPITSSANSHDIKVVSSEGTFYESLNVHVNYNAPASTVQTEEPEPITHGVISIAFDDGYQSVYQNGLPVLEQHGVHSTIYMVSDAVGNVFEGYPCMTANQLLTLQNEGHEIGSHGKSHVYFPGLTDSKIREELSVSKQALESYGLTVNNFAYPYGDANSATNNIALEYYRSARTAYEGHGSFNMKIGSSNCVLTGYPGENDAYIYDQVDSTASSNSWTIVFFHSVVTEYSNPIDPYSISVEDFNAFIDYSLSKGIQFMTVNEALNLQSP